MTSGERAGCEITGGKVVCVAIAVVDEPEAADESAGTMALKFKSDGLFRRWF